MVDRSGSTARQEGLSLDEMLHFPLCKAQRSSRRLSLSQLATVCGEDKIRAAKCRCLDVNITIWTLQDLCFIFLCFDYYYSYFISLFSIPFPDTNAEHVETLGILLQGAALLNMRIPWSIALPPAAPRLSLNDLSMVHEFRPTKTVQEILV